MPPAKKRYGAFQHDKQPVGMNPNFAVTGEKPLADPTQFINQKSTRKPSPEKKTMKDHKAQYMELKEKK